MNSGGRIPTEEQYPYKMNMDYCRQNTTKFSPLKLTSYKWVHGVENVMSALVNIGPLAVMVSTMPAPSWTYYHRGIYNDDYCIEFIPDHIVLLIGYLFIFIYIIFIIIFIYLYLFILYFG
jgi:hypothetical protein